MAGRVPDSGLPVWPKRSLGPSWISALNRSWAAYYPQRLAMLDPQTIAAKSAPGGLNLR
jgi:hypothetical protein